MDSTPERNTNIGVIHTIDKRTEFRQSAAPIWNAKVNEREMPVPGKRYRLTSISADAGLIHKLRCYRIYSNDAGSQNVMIISQCYKNDEDSIRRYLRQLDEVENNCQLPFFHKDFDGMITILGRVVHRSYRELIVQRRKRTARIMP